MDSNITKFTPNIVFYSEIMDIFSFMDSFLILISFLIFLQVYKKFTCKDKEFIKPGECVGLEAVPKVKNVIPLKLIGIIPKFWPLSRSISEALKMHEGMRRHELFRGEGMGRDIVMFNSGSTLQTLLKSGNFGHVHKEPLVYENMKPFINNAVLVSDGPFWQKQRKLLMKSQSFQNLKVYMEMLNRHSERLVQKLETLFQDGKSHEINDQLNVTFLEIICEMITGSNSDLSEELHHYHENFCYWKDSIAARVVNPLLLVKPLWKIHPRYRKYERVVKELNDFAWQRINEKKEIRAKLVQDNANNSTNQPLFCSVIDELLDAGVEEEQIVDEINVMIFGGHETGATGTHCLLLALALNPEVQRKARQEVDEFWLNMKNGNITLEEAQGCLKYVERCIMEALRLFPPVFAVFRQLTSPLKVDFEGKSVLIPSGTFCTISPLAMHRHPEIYPDPLKFNPDRFLPEECKKRHPYTYIPFSAGPRNCLGQKFAMAELKILTTYILRNFEISTTDKLEDITWLPYTTLTPSKNFNFRFNKRNEV